MIQYKGAHWYKCDFHVHTPASACFKDKSVTPEQWVQRAQELHLDCIAVTDHNTGDWIDAIKTAAESVGLVVFPGVEITCDTSKIHLLVLFDRSRTSQDINDFLIRCGINRTDFAKADAHSAKTIFEIAELANEAGAIVIPAHVDEFNGLGCCASNDSIDRLLNLNYINAIQFVHKEYLQKGLTVSGNEELKDAINFYYGNPTIEIGYDSIKNGYNCIWKAIDKKISLLTFSDNPDKDEPSKHGLSGIGHTYSWLKMGDDPDLEGIRQALMFKDRNANCFEVEDRPYKEPDLWIKSISIQNTTLTDQSNVVQVDFNPALTTIIGGRGSGKSSILRFLRGVFHKTKDIEGLDEIIEEQNAFFKLCDGTGIGVLKKDSKIRVDFVRDALLYRITYDYSTNGENTIERFNPSSNVFEPVTDEFFIDFFDIEQYSQKQIFAIAQKPNELRNRIDSAISNVGNLQSECNQILSSYNQAIATRNNLNQAISIKQKLLTEIKDYESKIQMLQQSGISELLKDRRQFQNQNLHLDNFYSDLDIFQSKLAEGLKLYDSIPSLDYDIFDEKYREEISTAIEGVRNLILSQKDSHKAVVDRITESIANVNTLLKSGGFNKDYIENHNQFEAKKTELESNGITDLSDFKKYTDAIEQKKKELEDIAQKESERSRFEEQIRVLEETYYTKRNEITEKRKAFIREFNTDKVRIKINRFRDSVHFLRCFRAIVQRSSGYDKSMDVIKNKLFASGSVEESLKALKNDILDIWKDSYQGSDYDGYFTNLIHSLTQEQINRIMLLYPEDEVEMTYKNSSGAFRPLSVASAGQKTTAILTFILSFGSAPLVLDQPEDDLDNHLVYALIVDKIREIKKKRQVIVVTHNANIPVNGDAEYIISMSSNSHNLQVQAQGTIEKEDVKNEICEVMEGGIQAFDTRAKKYKRFTP